MLYAWHAQPNTCKHLYTKTVSEWARGRMNICKWRMHICIQRMYIYKCRMHICIWMYLYKWRMHICIWRISINGECIAVYEECMSECKKWGEIIMCQPYAKSISVTRYFWNIYSITLRSNLDCLGMTEEDWFSLFKCTNVNECKALKATQP